MARPAPPDAWRLPAARPRNALEQLPCWRDSEGFTERDRLVLEFA